MIPTNIKTKVFKYVGSKFHESSLTSFITLMDEEYFLTPKSNRLLGLFEKKDLSRVDYYSYYVLYKHLFHLEKMQQKYIMHFLHGLVVKSRKNYYRIAEIAKKMSKKNREAFLRKNIDIHIHPPMWMLEHVPGNCLECNEFLSKEDANHMQKTRRVTTVCSNECYLAYMGRD